MDFVNDKLCAIGFGGTYEVIFFFGNSNVSDMSEPNWTEEKSKHSGGMYFLF